jgi:hypothetical protein
VSKVWGQDVRRPNRLRGVRTVGREQPSSGEKLPSSLPRSRLGSRVRSLSPLLGWSLPSNRLISFLPSVSLRPIPSHPPRLEPNCHACSRPFPPLPSHPLQPPPGTEPDEGGVSPTGRYRCRKCKNDFCAECDALSVCSILSSSSLLGLIQSWQLTPTLPSCPLFSVHESLHVCPGCG